MKLQSVPGEAGNLSLHAGTRRLHRRSLLSVDRRRRDLDRRSQCVAGLLLWFRRGAPGQSYPAFTSLDGSTTSMASGNQSTMLNHGPRSGHIPNNSLDEIKTISGDPNIYGQVYVGFAGSGYAYLLSDGPSSQR